jgi:hypothetical protein
VCVTAAIAEHFDLERESSAERDASSCRAAERCELGEMCNWTSARARASECYRPFGGPYTARCGRYDSIVSSGIDSAITYYYGADGALVGTNSVGLGSEGCVSYDGSFTLPASCTPTSTTCSEDDAGSGDPGESDAGTTDSGTNDSGTMDAGATDAGTADAGTSEGGQQDSASLLCDCANEEVSLACVCAQGQGWCLTFEQAVTNVLCGSTPVPPSLEQGCGYKMVRRGVGFQTYVYQGADDTLVGAFIYSDVPFGTCSRPTYGTQMPELETCADYSICDLCPTGANPCQL